MLWADGAQKHFGWHFGVQGFDVVILSAVLLALRQAFPVYRFSIIGLLTAHSLLEPVFPGDFFHIVNRREALSTFHWWYMDGRAPPI